MILIFLFFKPMNGLVDIKVDWCNRFCLYCRVIVSQWHTSKMVWSKFVNSGWVWRLGTTTNMYDMDYQTSNRHDFSTIFPNYLNLAYLEHKPTFYNDFKYYSRFMQWLNFWFVFCHCTFKISTLVFILVKHDNSFHLLNKIFWMDQNGRFWKVLRLNQQKEEI